MVKLRLGRRSNAVYCIIIVVYNIVQGTLANKQGSGHDESKEKTFRDMSSNNETVYPTNKRRLTLVKPYCPEFDPAWLNCCLIKENRDCKTCQHNHRNRRNCYLQKCKIHCIDCRSRGYGCNYGRLNSWKICCKKANKNTQSTTGKPSTRRKRKSYAKTTIPGIILSGVGILSTLVVSIYLYVKRCAAEGSLHSDAEDDEHSESSSDEGYDLETFNDEELVGKAIFEWWLERDIRTQEMADSFIFSTVQSKRLEFKYERKNTTDNEEQIINEPKDRQDPENGQPVYCTIVDIDTKDKKVKSKSRKTTSQAELFTINDFKKEGGKTTVKVLVNKPTHEAMKSEDLGTTYEDQTDILDVDTAKAHTTHYPIYEEPECSKARSMNNPMRKPIPHTDTACLQTYEKLKHNQIKKRDHQIGLTSTKIEIDKVDEIKNNEEQKQLRRTPGRDGIYNMSDNANQETRM